MIDHLMRFATEAEAIAALPQFRWRDGKESGWDMAQCIPDTKVYAVTGSITVTDPDTKEKYQVEARDYVPGWFIQVGLKAEDKVLNKLASATIINRDTKARTKVDSVVAAKAGWRVEPVFAGS